MKIAISSSSFAEPLASGNLTQLEWLERCASELAADGVVFDKRHFPRLDAEYVAQLKKIGTDLGLVPVALHVPQLLGEDSAAALEESFAVAAGLGAIFMLTRLPAAGDVPPAAFVAAVAAAKVAARTAKRVNVTLLAAPQEGTVAADLPDLRHFVKDVDSAWLRYAVPLHADRSFFGPRDRALVVTVGASDDSSAADVAEGARPWLLLEGRVDAQRVCALRAAAAKKTLAAANVS
ncbi:MAG: hypothetical protein ABR591_00295 [Candidatus Velthaea sp.]